MERTSEHTSPVNEPRNFARNAAWTAGALFLLLLALGLYFREAKAPVGTGVDVAAVTENPNEFVGRTVTVQGEVENVLGPRAFILEDEGPGGEILVVTGATDAMPPATELEDTDDVRVVGEVRAFDGKVQGDVGIPATDDRMRRVHGKPVLYAFQVIVPGQRDAESAGPDTARN